MQAGTKKEAFAYRVPIGDYNYLQCNVIVIACMVCPALSG